MGAGGQPGQGVLVDGEMVEPPASGLLGHALAMVDATGEFGWVGVDQDGPDLQVLAARPSTISRR